MKKPYFVVIIFLLLLFSGCTQKPAQVVHKRNNTYNPNYSEVYVESPDGKIARSLRGYNNAEKAQNVNIISKNNASNDFSKTSIYTVKSGDNLSSIAREYSMTTAELAAINNLNTPYNLKIGQKLTVNNVENNRVKVTKMDTYTVKSGDTLSSIANKNNMKTSELATLNNLESPYNLRVGQNLKISVSDYATNNNVKEIKTYVVQSGDNLSSIAQKNNITTAELAKLNDLKIPYNLRVGQKLTMGEKVIVKKASEQKINDTNTTSQTAGLDDKNKKNSFIWPVKGSIVSNFGNKANGLYNDGINISATKGSPFKAAENGVVAYVGNELRGYGTIVLIKHNNNWISAYAHCDSVNVSRGDMVEKGQVIGTVGKTGSVESPQLYFSLRSGRKAVDPLQYLN